MTDKPPPRSTTIWVAIIGAFATIVVALIAILPDLLGHRDEDGDDPPPPPPPPLALVHFTEPTPNAKLRAGDNFALTGEVTGLPSGSKLWVVIGARMVSPTEFYGAAPGPLADSNGVWRDDYNIFAPSAASLKRYFAIQADANCDKELRKSVGPDTQTATLPQGCEVVGTLDVEWVP